MNLRAKWHAVGTRAARETGVACGITASSHDASYACEN